MGNDLGIYLPASILDISADACFVLGHDWEFTYVNPKVVELTGIPREQLLSMTVWETLCEPACQQLQYRYSGAMERGAPVEMTWNMPGTPDWYELRLFPLPSGLLVVMRDTTEHRRKELTLAGQNRVLEALIADQGEEQVLTALCDMLESQLPDAFSSIMVTSQDGRYLRLGAAPRIDPTLFIEYPAIPIGPQSGSCGTAAFLREAVLTVDIMTDPLWESWRSIPERYGLGACWSIPILSHAAIDPVLGTFAVYFREPRQPTAAELAVMDEAVNLAQIVLERFRARREMQRADTRFRFLVEQMPAVVYSEGIIPTDGGTQRFYISPRIHDLVGYTPEEWERDDPWLTLIHQADRARVTRENRHADETGEPFISEYRMLHRDGHEVWVRDEAILIRDDQDGPLYWQGILVDITDEKHVAEELKVSEELFRGAFEDAGICMLIAALDGKLLRVNSIFCDMLGYSEEELLKTDSGDITHPDDMELTQRSLCQLVSGSLSRVTLEKRYLHKDGRVIWAILNLSIVHDANGHPLRMLGQIQDITERKQLEADLEHQALHDTLTGLPNRALLLDRTQQALAEYRRHHRPLAMLFVDVDNFKVVNDSLGHATGDRLLIDIANRLASCLRAEDTAARVGGDEFAVLVKPGTDPASITALAERIIAVTRKPYIIGEHRFQVTMSIGIAQPTVDTDGPDDLLRWADIAMYRAKTKGKNRYDIFDPEMHALALRQLELQNELTRAIEHDELTLHYQPKFSLQGGGIVGFEALVRWDHPTYGQIPPSEFIPLAEESGLVVPLGNWVLEHACRQMQAWRISSPLMSELSVSVNLSARQFQETRLVEEVWGVLATTGLPSNCLILEITESAMMSDLDMTGHILQTLTRLGVRLAIDDFGMGYSSLSQVKRFPLNFLKIDRHFINDLGVELEGTVIVSGILSLAHALGISVIAEGVETEAQIEQLRELGCDIAQGFYFSKPIPPELVEDFVRQHGVVTIPHDQAHATSGAPLRDTGDLYASLAALMLRQEQVQETNQHLTEAISNLRYRLGQRIP